MIVNDDRRVQWWWWSLDLGGTERRNNQCDIKIKHIGVCSNGSNGSNCSNGPFAGFEAPQFWKYPYPVTGNGDIGDIVISSYYCPLARLSSASQRKSCRPSWERVHGLLQYIHISNSIYNSMMAISSRKTHHNSPNSPLDHLKSSRCFSVSSGCHGLIPPRHGYRLWSHPKKKQCPEDPTGEGTTIQQLLSNVYHYYPTNQHLFPQHSIHTASSWNRMY